MSDDIYKILKTLKQQLLDKDSHIQKFSLIKTCFQAIGENGDKIYESDLLDAKITTFKYKFNIVTKRIDRIETSSHLTIRTRKNSGEIEFTSLSFEAETVVTESEPTNRQFFKYLYRFLRFVFPWLWKFLFVDSCTITSLDPGILHF